MGLGMMLTFAGSVMAIWGLHGLRLSSCEQCGAVGSVERRALDSDNQVGSIVEIASIRHCAACGVCVMETTRHMPSRARRRDRVRLKVA
jgi:hypothetical protein